MPSLLKGKVVALENPNSSWRYVKRETKPVLVSYDASAFC